MSKNTECKSFLSAKGKPFVGATALLIGVVIAIVIGATCGSGLCKSSSSAIDDIQCGDGIVGNGICADASLCCSGFGWCGTSNAHCNGTNLDLCGDGKIGNGTCTDTSLCYSEFGCCGTTDAHCSGMYGEGIVGNGRYVPTFPIAAWSGAIVAPLKNIAAAAKAVKEDY